MQLTKWHLAKNPLVDLTSEEIVHSIKELSGWLSKVKVQLPRGKSNCEVDVREWGIGMAAGDDVLLPLFLRTFNYCPSFFFSL